MGTSTEASLSRVERRKARTNKRLLEVARQLFSEKGIYWAKVEDITELADLGKGTFYKYFDSKEQIISALVEEGLSDLLAKTEAAVHAASSDGRIILNVIGARVDFFLAYPDYLLLLHQVRGLMQLQVGVAEELRVIYAMHLSGIAKLVKPVIGSTNAHDVAVAIAAYTSGLMTYHLLFEGIEGIRRRRNELVLVLDQSVQVLLKVGRPRT